MFIILKVKQLGEDIFKINFMIKTTKKDLPIIIEAIEKAIKQLT
jgi:aspartate aminotransferase-like enzyme